MKRSFLQVILAQGVVLLASLAKSLIIPKMLSIDGFAYWQVYILYSGFVGVFALGYTDGVYLRYGGLDYGQLPFKRLRASNKVFFAVLIALSTVSCCFSLLVDDAAKSFALLFVSLDIVVVGVSGLLLYVLQITNRIKSYSFLSAFDKVLMLVLIVGIALAAVPDYRIFILCDFFTKLTACVVLLAYCKDTFYGQSDSLANGVKGYLQEVKVGFSLLVANLAGMIAVNIGRIIIELFGGTADYAYYSFGITVTNLVLTFVSAIALVLYPNLKRMNHEQLIPFFVRISSGATLVSALGLLAFFPITIFIELVFPQYAPLLAYLNLLFLAVVGQVKMQLLNNTYYKTLRLEKRLLAVNAQSILCFIVLGGLSFYFTHDVWWVAFATAIVMLVRSWLSEYELRNKLKIHHSRTLVVEMAACVIFFLLSVCLSGLVQGLALTVSMASIAALCVFRTIRESRV